MPRAKKIFAARIISVKRSRMSHRRCAGDRDLTRWPQFEQLAALVAKVKPQPLIVDGRRMLAKDAFERYAGDRAVMMEATP